MLGYDSRQPKLSEKMHCKEWQADLRGSGWGALGRAVASDSRDPRFKPIHGHFHLLTVLQTVLKRRK